MNAQRAQLWQALVAAGLASGEPPAASDDAPWYVKAMLGAAGWVAAVFLLGFFGAVFTTLFRGGIMAVVVGALACGAAALLTRALPRSTFAGQFGMALSFSGQVLVAIGLIEQEHARPWLLLAGFEAVLFFAVPSLVHRVWSAALALLVAAWAARWMGVAELMPALATGLAAALWLREFGWPQRASAVRAAAYGFTLAAVVLHGAVFAHFAPWVDAMVFAPDVAARLPQALPRLLNTVVIVAATGVLLRREGVALASGIGSAAIGGALGLALATWHAPGVAAGGLFLVLGFANGNRVLMGIGTAALVGYLSHYYYQLQLTLLMKSAVLAGTGAALLAARVALSAWLGRGEAARA